MQRDGDLQHGLGRDPEQGIVDDSLVLVSDIGDLPPEAKKPQVCLAVAEPFLRGGTLALRAMPVAAGVVGDRRIGAALAARDMATEGCRAAALEPSPQDRAAPLGASGLVQ